MPDHVVCHGLEPFFTFVFLEVTLALLRPFEAIWNERRQAASPWWHARRSGWRKVRSEGWNAAVRRIPPGKQKWRKVFLHFCFPGGNLSTAAFHPSLLSFRHPFLLACHLGLAACRLSFHIASKGLAVFCFTFNLLMLHNDVSLLAALV